MPKLELKLPDPISKAIVTPTNNILNPTCKSIGKGLGNLFNIIFNPFHYFNKKQKIKYLYKLKQYQQNLQNKINNIPEEKLCEPDLQTVGTALENSKFCIDSDELTEMFAKLISSSINIDTKDFVHPAFSEIIKQMTPLEAKIISYLKNKEVFPICKYLEIVEDGYKIITTNILIYQDNENNIDKNSYSVTNLERLGLVSITYSDRIIDDNEYNPYEDFKSRLVNDLLPIDKITMRKGYVSITPLGKQFVKVCIPN